MLHVNEFLRFRRHFQIPRSSCIVLDLIAFILFQIFRWDRIWTWLHWTRCTFEMILVLIFLKFNWRLIFFILLIQFNVKLKFEMKWDIIRFQLRFEMTLNTSKWWLIQLTLLQVVELLWLLNCIINQIYMIQCCGLWTVCVSAKLPVNFIDVLSVFWWFANGTHESAVCRATRRRPIVVTQKQLSVQLSASGE